MSNDLTPIMIEQEHHMRTSNQGKAKRWRYRYFMLWLKSWDREIQYKLAVNKLNNQF